MFEHEKYVAPLSNILKLMLKGKSSTEITDQLITAKPPRPVEIPRGHWSNIDYRQPEPPPRKKIVFFRWENSDLGVDLQLVKREDHHDLYLDFYNLKTDRWAVQFVIDRSRNPPWLQGLTPMYIDINNVDAFEKDLAMIILFIG